MALIKCKECGHMVSDKADSCPKCGYPLITDNTPQLNKEGNSSNPNSNSNKSLIFIVILVSLIVTGIGWCIWQFQKDTITTPTITNKPKMEIILYSDDSGEILNDSSKRICGIELIGGRKGTLHISTSIPIDFFGMQTSHIYIEGDRAFKNFDDVLAYKYHNGQDGISCIRKSEGSELHYLLGMKDKISGMKNKNVKITSQENSTEKSIVERLKKAKTKDEVSKLIDGTTWHYTESLRTSDIGCWIKVKFNGNQYTTYYAKPNDAKWTEGGNGIYKVTEGRYADSGNRYISIDWQGDLNLGKSMALVVNAEMSLTTDYLTLRVHSRQVDAVLSSINNPIISTGTMEFGDYYWN